jgi:UbiD family decarboxylase
MGYKSMAACVADLEKNGHLIRIKEEVDPYLEMASIHLRVHAAKGPAILFENVQICLERSSAVDSSLEIHWIKLKRWFN